MGVVGVVGVADSGLSPKSIILGGDSLPSRDPLSLSGAATRSYTGYYALLSVKRIMRY